jgi:BirA family transcriptional regulator, biotin operon repressor / biotin---[acetyl-CoA-carboxylase] ligase
MNPSWLHWLEQCPSTNSWAIAHAAQLQQGDVVFTRQQTAGRGQHGRTWYAPPGVLTASFVLENIPLAPGFPLAVGLAVIAAVEELVPALAGELQLKWANDVFLRERKLAGILCEGVIKSSAEQGRVVVGVGLNRRVEFEEEWTGRAISLHEVAGLSAIAPDELPLLERLRHHLLVTAAGWQSQGITPFLPTLRQRDFLLGKSITIEVAGESVTGTADGISEGGELRLRFSDGTYRTFMSGHIPEGGGIGDRGAPPC